MATVTVSGGGSLDVSSLPQSSVTAVGDAFATLNTTVTAKSSTTLTSLSSAPSTDPTVLTVYTVNADTTGGGVMNVPTNVSTVAVIISGTTNAQVVGSATATNQVIVGNAGNDVINTGGGASR